MLRKFNYTNRRKLEKDRISISLDRSGLIPRFSVTFDLSQLRIPGEAKVYVEAYYRTTTMRFSFGTADVIVEPENTELTEIPDMEGLQFRVKIVDESETLGRIIRYADKLKPVNWESENANKSSLLPVSFENDLGQQIFKVSFDDEKEPVIQFNNRISNIRELVKGNEFLRALVFPVVLKEIAMHIFQDGELLDSDNDVWQVKWNKYFTETLGISIPPDIETTDIVEKHYWADEIVNQFCNKYKIRNKFEGGFKE